MPSSSDLGDLADIGKGVWVDLHVRVRVEPCTEADEGVTVGELKPSVEEAVRVAIRRDVNDGFSHPLENETSIALESVTVTKVGWTDAAAES